MVREASRADIPLLATLHARHFRNQWNEAAFASFFARDGVIALVYEEEAHMERSRRDSALSSSHREGQEPAAGDTLHRAFLFGWVAAGEGELLSIAVDEALRGRGLARHLCEIAMARSKKLGAKVMHLEVAMGNAPARALYSSLGFEVVRRRKAYYRYPDGTCEDALSMRCDV